MIYHTAIEHAASVVQLSHSPAFIHQPAAWTTPITGSKFCPAAGVTVRYRPGYAAARDAAIAPALANPISLTGIGLTAQLHPVEGGYRLSVTVDPRNITLEPKDGKWTGALQFLVVVGKVEQLTTVPLSFTESVFHQIEDKGLVLGARVKTPPGTKEFSLGFRDMTSGLVGTLDVAL
jgi:hypothetical protein